MGHRYEVECGDCGCRFMVSEGGGFMFHLLHCDKCGEEKTVVFDEIGEMHFRYLKGLEVPYSVATGESDRRIQETYDQESISEQEYRAYVEGLAGTCACGGRFRFEAGPRCSDCSSGNYSRTEDGVDVFYD